MGNQGPESDVALVRVDTSRPETTVSIATYDAFVNTSTPLIEGSLSQALAAGETLVVFERGRVIGEAQVDGLGWSFVPATGVLSSGLSEIRLAVRAASGVLGAVSDPYVFSIDATAPTVVFDNTIGTDGGATATVTSGSGSVLTRDSTLALRGTAFDAVGLDRVEIYDGATRLGDANLSSAGWTFVTPALSAGDHVLTAKAIDVAGNVQTSEQVRVSVDTTPPGEATVADVAGDNQINAQEVAAGNVVLSGTAEAGARVQIQLGASSGGARVVTTDAQGQWSYAVRKEDFAAWGQGVRTVNVTVSDAAGNTSTTVSKSMLIDTLAPTLTPVALTDASDTGTKGDGRTSSVAPAIQFTAEAGSQVAVDWTGAGVFGAGVAATGAVQSVTAPVGTCVADG